MAEPLAPLSELPFFAANRKGLRHGAKVTKKENQMKSEKKFLVTGPAQPVVKRLNSYLRRDTPFERLLTERMNDRNDSANWAQRSFLATFSTWNRYVPLFVESTERISYIRFDRGSWMPVFDLLRLQRRLASKSSSTCHKSRHAKTLKAMQHCALAIGACV